MKNSSHALLDYTDFMHLIDAALSTDPVEIDNVIMKLKSDYPEYADDIEFYFDLHNEEIFESELTEADRKGIRLKQNPEEVFIPGTVYTLFHKDGHQVNLKLVSG